MPKRDSATQAALLAASPLFSGMSPAETERAMTLLQASVRPYEKGAYLHRMGEPLSAFGLVLEGQVQVYTDDKDGERVMMASVTAGGTFGESLCFLALPAAPVHIVSAEGAVVLWLRTDTLRATAPHDPFAAKLLCRFTAMLATRTLDMNDRIQILTKRTLRDKIMTFLLEWKRHTQSSTFSIPFDRAAMAAYLGVNRTALSRELSRMQTEGILSYYKDTFKLYP